MKDDPCFACTLPECDDRHSDCQLRVLANSYARKVSNRALDMVTAAERDASNRMFHAWDLERRAEASEGGRPFRHIGVAQPAVQP